MNESYSANNLERRGVLMSSEEKPLKGNDAARAMLLAEERRSGTRVRILKHVRIRHLDSSHPEELGTITNLSRDGLNFIARSNHFQIGMELRLTLPYTGSECTCEVMRIQHLENGRLGIGVRILTW